LTNQYVIKAFIWVIVYISLVFIDKIFLREKGKLIWPVILLCAIVTFVLILIADISNQLIGVTLGIISGYSIICILLGKKKGKKEYHYDSSKGD